MREESHAEIERARARMSETIDEIEDVLLRKRASIQERMDVLAPVREQPMRSVALALGAGIIFGFLTGGSDNREIEMNEPEDDHWKARADEWENRARRLLRIAQAQEYELSG